MDKCFIKCSIDKEFTLHINQQCYELRGREGKHMTVPCLCLTHRRGQNLDRWSSTYTTFCSPPKLGGFGGEHLFLNLFTHIRLTYYVRPFPFKRRIVFPFPSLPFSIPSTSTLPFRLSLDDMMNPHENGNVILSSHDYYV